jgi:hypothetical protein
MKAKYPPHHVQRGVSSVTHSAAGTMTTNVAISDVGSLVRACERMNGVTSVSSSSLFMAASVRLTSATNLEITSYASAATTLYVNWEVEYGDYQDAIQRGTTTINFPGGCTEISSDVSVGDVGDASKTRLECGHHPDAASWHGSRVALTSNTNLRVFSTGSSCNIITRWLVCRVNP